MILNKIKLVIITLILFLNGCTEKDDLTLPVKVDFKIGISDNPSKDEYLTFTGGKIGVRRIQFDGKREAGGDVFFETDPKINFSQLAFNASSQPVTISDFDIPQGIFNYMKWDINLKEIVIDELIEDDDDDTDSPEIGLTISGVYTYLSSISIPFIIVVDIAEQFSVKSFDPDGNSTIVLSVDKYYEAILLLDPAYAFHSISRESLEEADVSDNSGIEIIIISSDENEDLYEDLLYRIAQSVRVVVK
jgi:hypothetical protein